MDTSTLYLRSDSHNLSGKVKQNETSSKNEYFVKVKGKRDQGAENATVVTKQKEELAICCKKLKAKEDLSSKETENIVNCLEQYDPPAKRVKREEIGRVHDINVLTCKKVLETSGADKDRNSDGNTELKLLVSIGDEIEKGSTWIKVYLNGELTEELVKDLDGAIELYQDPTEPNKRRTDYENVAAKYLQKKVEFSTSDIRIKEIKVQLSELPRYEYALGNLLDVVMRYKVVLQSNCMGHDDRYILFYICTTSENDKMIDVFLQEISKKGKIRDSVSLEQFVQFKDQSTVSCFITPFNYQDIWTEIRHRTTITFILGDTDLEEKAVQRCKNTYAIHINNAWKKIDSVLENWLFQSLKSVCEALGVDIESNRLDKNATNRDDEQTNETNGIICLKTDMLSTLKTETKVCLFEEVIGLFNMSDVSIDDIPNIPKYRSDLDLKEICRHLSSKFEGIRGVGCRLQKLQIAVKDGQSFSTEEKQKMLREVLEDFKIHEYEIVPMSMKKYLASGDEIAVGHANSRRGSFGCFAKADETENEATVMFGLISKHLVPSREQIKELHVMEGGELKSVGKIIGSTLKGDGHDIAAAALSITKDECDTRFKTVSGKQISGEKRIIEPKELTGRKVHIWGAKSKPGKGIITVPDFHCNGKMDYNLILVKDIADGEGIVEKRFAQPGDSGAIACTDVPGQESVIPISMIMGELYKKDEDTKQNVEESQNPTYATVPLHSGLEQISERIGKKVELCCETGH
ncbi:uncharacterized protein LOC132720667 [Ruditapes philippinarum]|uniref:uncharacterized protein LOC132720667 n=1 Tax=Ruditapes philippinarum TaxID=129788 RepID=UPI00295BF910|nr:uncharacterized protein LOC132720667 [Ruditapes philippinarum]